MGTLKHLFGSIPDQSGYVQMLKLFVIHLLVFTVKSRFFSDLKLCRHMNEVRCQKLREEKAKSKAMITGSRICPLYCDIFLITESRNVALSD